MAKKSLISVALDGSILSFTVGEAGSLSLDTNELKEEIRNSALMHGLVQKVSDAAAMPKDELTGDAAKDAATKLAAMRAVVERLTGDDPSWNKRAGDGAGPVAGLIFRAFSQWVADMATAAKKPVPTDEAIKARYDAMDRKSVLALRNVEAIAKIIERIKSERPAKDADKVDTKSLLKELGI